MTKQTTIFLTALPNGIVNGKVRLSVFVTPKLLGGAGENLKLSDYPVMKNWAENVKGLQFTLFCKKSSNNTYQIGNGAKYKPTNKGEFGLDQKVWDHIFGSRNVIVEPEQADISPAMFALRRRDQNVVDVHYRNRAIDRTVTETQVLHTRLSLLRPGESAPKAYQFNPDDKVYALQSEDRLVKLSQSPSSGFDPKEFPSYNKEKNEFTFRQATDVSSAFLEGKYNSIENLEIGDAPLTAEEIVDHYQSFCEYHRHGVKNRNYQIRRGNGKRSQNPEFNFADGEIYSISDGDNGKLLEFAEPMKVSLPAAGSVEAGFEISLFFNPNEVTPEADVKTSAEILKAFRRLDGKYNHMTVSSFGADIFVDGNNSRSVPAFRGKTFIRSDNSKWIERPIEEQDFHSIVSGFGSYPILLRKLGFVFDIEFDETDIPVGESEFSVLAEPVFSGNASIADLQIFPQWSKCVKNELGAELENGLQIRSFAMATGTDTKFNAIGGIKVLNSNAGGENLYVGHSLQDIDVAARKTFHKSIADGAPIDYEDPYRTTNAYSVDDRIPIPGSPTAVARENGVSEAPELNDEHNLSASRSTGISVYLDKEGKGAVEKYQNERRSIDVDPNPTANNVFWPKNNNGKEDLTFDDVIVGCKVDVYVSGPYVNGFDSEFEKWYPLCARQTTFSFGDQGENKLGHYLAPADDFWIEAAGNKEVDEQQNVQLRVNDYLFRWDGWSIVAPHPSQPAPETGADQDDQWARSVDVTIKPEVVPISLPKLRYGRDYWFRTRAADLAGNGVHVDFANAYLGNPGDKLSDQVTTQKITYRRHDPISPPSLYALQLPGPGNRAKTKKDKNGTKPKMVGPDKTDILVIRSGENIPKKLSSADWLVLPPDTDFQEADWAGMLDGFKKPNTAHRVLVRYSKLLPEQYEPDFLQSIKWSSKIGTPYLPDGYAAGATFSFLPEYERFPTKKGANLAARADTAINSHFPVSFNLKTDISTTSEPYSQSFKLRLKSGERKTKFSSKILRVQLPPGEQQLVMLSSYPDEERLDHFCLVHWAFNAQEQALVQTGLDNKSLGLSAASLNAEKATIVKTLNAGLHGPITPAKPIRLIHAVPKPVHAPEFSDKLQITNRVTGGNAVVMEDTGFKLHKVSTGKIDIFAEWDEYSDIPGDPECPRIRRERRHCFKCEIPLPDLTIKPDETHQSIDIGSRHNFPNNKHLAMKYVAVATTRYKEYFGEEITSDPANLIVESEPSCELHVYNTAPPPPPEIVYILPLFIWEKGEKTADGQEEPTRTIRRRTGFRVYVKRGWFRSGKDERLAVVLQTEADSIFNHGEIPPQTYPVTQWGSDPIWYDRRPITRQPVLNDFIGTTLKVVGCEPIEDEDFDQNNPPKPSPTITTCASAHDHCLVTSVDGVPLPVPEIPAVVETKKPTPEERKLKSREADKQGADLSPENEIVVDIAAYGVECDQEKDLIYADVELKPSCAYMPFVKFALARYQQHSAKYCHMSSIVSADFVQLSPDRFISVKKNDVEGLNEDGVTIYSIAVSGPAKGYKERGFAENTLRVTKIAENGTLDQYSLELDGAWSSKSEYFVWSGQVPSKAGNSILIEELELLDAHKRVVFSTEVKLN